MFCLTFSEHSTSVAVLLVCFIEEIVIFGSQICYHLDLSICHSYPVVYITHSIYSIRLFSLSEYSWCFEAPWCKLNLYFERFYFEIVDVEVVFSWKPAGWKQQEWREMSYCFTVELLSWLHFTYGLGYMTPPNPHCTTKWYNFHNSILRLKLR